MIAMAEQREQPATQPKRVAYLLGAGATHGAIRHAGGTVNQLMTGLGPKLLEGMTELIRSNYGADPRLLELVNVFLVDSETAPGFDFEHLTTFFEDSPSPTHRGFAEDLKTLFTDVLSTELDNNDRDVADATCDLFAAFVDMHSVAGLPPENAEVLAGILTLNYDTYLETAIAERLGLAIDFGVGPRPQSNSVRVLKLHGSFGWEDDWPIRFLANRNHIHSLCIPPGIRKAKGKYPFNMIWGTALDVLECDILRLVGCNLSPNDWDLVSLVFSSKYSHALKRPLDVQVIGRPEDAEAIRHRHPYLFVHSLLELPDVGRSIVLDATGRDVSFAELTDAERAAAVLRLADFNAFEYWLAQRAEYMENVCDVRQTPTGTFGRFADDYVGR
jgi:hypothetical protein